MRSLPALAGFALLATAAAVAQDAAAPAADEVAGPAAGLEQQLAEALVERNAARSEAARLAASVELELAAAQADRNELAQLRQENSTYEARLEQYRGSIPWPWVAAALVVALGAGFVGGWWWLDASIRRRYGGFKMY